MGEKLQMKQHCPHPDLLQVDPFEAIIDEELEPGDILYIPPGFPNGRFVAGALALGFVSLPLLAWIAQSPIIIITGEQLSSYEYGLLQVPIFGALIAGNLLLARLTSRRTVRSLTEFESMNFPDSVRTQTGYFADKIISGRPD